MSQDNPNLNQLNSGLANISIDSESNSDWGVLAKESKNQDVAPNARPWGSSTVIPNAWDSEPKTQEENSNVTADKDSIEDDAADDNDDVSDDDYYEEFSDYSNGDFSDDCDSDASEKSHETRKRNKWLKPFFEAMDSLKVEQITEPSRQWHCPGCHDGPVAIRWFKGMHALITHANTRRSQRIKLHREFAFLLEEELQKRGALVVLAGEGFGKWKGLRNTPEDHEIVWPPMMVVVNTLLEKNEHDKWIGMGNQELLDYFSQYAALKARHLYGPSGHSGMSILIFEASAMGYEDAKRLHKKFADEGRDRDAWEQRKVLFYPGGKRQLYGYLARKEDLEMFNQHTAGKNQLKFEMKSYQEMVVDPMRKLSEDSKKLIWYTNKTVMQEQCLKAFEKSFEVVSQKLRDLIEENRILRLRTSMQHEENKEEMDRVHKGIKVKEQDSEKLLQEDAEETCSNMDCRIYADCKKRKEEIERFITSEVKGVEEFKAEKEKLIERHEEKKVELQHKHLEEDIELEKEFYAVLSQLMEKYTPSSFHSS